MIFYAAACILCMACCIVAVSETISFFKDWRRTVKIRKIKKIKKAFGYRI